mgnify:CR=1 FL=1
MSSDKLSKYLMLIIQEPSIRKNSPHLCKLLASTILRQKCREYFRKLILMDQGSFKSTSSLHSSLNKLYTFFHSARHLEFENAGSESLQTFRRWQHRIPGFDKTKVNAQRMFLQLGRGSYRQHDYGCWYRRRWKDQLVLVSKNNEESQTHMIILSLPYLIYLILS